MLLQQRLQLVGQTVHVPATHRAARPGRTIDFDVHSEQRQVVRRPPHVHRIGGLALTRLHARVYRVQQLPGRPARQGKRQARGIDYRSFKARGIERIPTIHEGYASREMEKRGGRGDLCEENRRIQALNRLLDALRAMIGRLSDQAQGILTAVKRRQRPSGAPQAPSSPEPAERPQERPQARETPPQAPQEPPKPIRTKKALTDRFKTRLDERLAENERKQAEKQAEPDMEETWDLSDPADPLNIGMGWGTGGHGLGL